ncbi:MAG: TonB-dependent receptor, partial [Cyclobacteriaceae bacterium]|nr:TonB-dependent receptor [Cyclobacteriaceae bacterium]
VVLTIELVPSIFTSEEIVIEASRNMGAGNEFTAVSGRSFTSEETQRYAGSINDPGRMAVSVPGVQFSQQDNQNTMAVRANSPFGLSWRLEGMEIPNPNHFAETGSSGGGISALSMFVLGESDFLSGAFPAEYGNAYAGVMDLNFRKGNTESRENRIQIGLIGLDFASEGPISKERKKGSYLLNYRYSTLGLLNAMGIRVVSPNVGNVFQDLSFNLFFPLSKKAFFTVFGLGGLSTETRDPVDGQWTSWSDYRTYHYPTNMGVTGATLTYLIDEKSYLYTAASLGGSTISFEQDTVNTALVPFRFDEEYYDDTRLAFTTNYNRQVSGKFNYKTGITLTNYFYDILKREWDYSNNVMNTLNQGDNYTLLSEVFLQGLYRFSESWSINAGLHGQHFSLNNTGAIEPRAGLNYKSPKGIEFNLGYGQHSRILPFNIYETTIPGTGQYKPNRELKMMNAKHYVAMLNIPFKSHLRTRIEPFYQDLGNVPVSANANSTFSAINQDDFFIADTLQNTGQGRNYGVEFTLEKFFSNQLFFLLTGTAYKSEYKTNNGGADVWYNTRYNSNYNAAFTTGKEWKIGEGQLLEAGGRLIYGGGMRFTPLDIVESRLQGKPIGIMDQAFTGQLQDYFRADLRVAYRRNTETRSWKLSLDIQNATNRKNLRRPFYDRYDGTIKYDPQSSLIPVISYTLDF